MPDFKSCAAEAQYREITEDCFKRTKGRPFRPRCLACTARNQTRGNRPRTRVEWSKIARNGHAEVPDARAATSAARAFFRAADAPGTAARVFFRSRLGGGEDRTCVFRRRTCV